MTHAADLLCSLLDWPTLREWLGDDDGGVDEVTIRLTDRRVALIRDALNTSGDPQRDREVYLTEAEWADQLAGVRDWLGEKYRDPLRW